MSFFAFLGCDDNDSVCSSCTIDCCGSSILQYCDILNVRRVQTCNTSLIDVINIIQVINSRYFISFHGNAIGGTACSNSRKTCNLSGQCLVNILYGSHSFVRNVYCRYCGGQLTAVNLLVTRYDKFCQCLVCKM